MGEKNRTGDTNGVLHMILQPDQNGEVTPEFEFRNFFCLLWPPATTPPALRSPPASRRWRISPSCWERCSKVARSG